MIHELSKYFEDKKIRRIEIDDEAIVYIKCEDGTTFVVTNVAGSKAVVPFKKGAYTIEVSSKKGIIPEWLKEKTYG